MTVIKYLDSDNFRYRWNPETKTYVPIHVHQPQPKFNDEDEVDFDAAYILTDDEWLKERIRTYAAAHHDTSRVWADYAYQTMSAAIPKSELALCIP